MTASPLISVTELRSLLQAGSAVQLLDVRYRLGFSDGRKLYEAGHIPGAIYVDLDSELAGHGAPDEGRHPLPAHASLQDSARRWGVKDGETVVVYDDARMLPASRAWWALRRTGVDVRLLDGGWGAWRAADGEVETGDCTAVPGNVTLADPTESDAIDTAHAAAWPTHGVLLDARTPERYRGETEPIDPIAGHIPGAGNLPIGEVLTPDGHFRSASEIDAAFIACGAGTATATAAYCGSGVTAAQLALAGAITGRQVAVYVGSWSAWSNTPGLPVATGDEN